MVNSINQIFSVFRTYNSQISSGKKEDKGQKLPNGTIPDIAPGKTDKVDSGEEKVHTANMSSKNSLKYSKNDENQVIVQVIRDKTGKIVRTIPLNEQHALDIFE